MGRIGGVGAALASAPPAFKGAWEADSVGRTPYGGLGAAGLPGSFGFPSAYRSPASGARSRAAGTDGPGAGRRSPKVVKAVRRGSG